MSLRCERCGYEMPMRGLETPEARADLAASARVSRIGAVQDLVKSRGYELGDGKILMNHLTSEDEAGVRRCYKCDATDFVDGQPCPRCRSLVLDW